MKVKSKTKFELADTKQEYLNELKSSLLARASSKQSPSHGRNNKEHKAAADEEDGDFARDDPGQSEKSELPAFVTKKGLSLDSLNNTMRFKPTDERQSRWKTSVADDIDDLDTRDDMQDSDEELDEKLESKTDPVQFDPEQSTLLQGVETDCRQGVDDDDDDDLARDD